ncbi:BlaI/MecI/CopY family transcriptional regulator [Thiomonas sp. FB-6]|uniref:BlaI/MecI/CopY family transcriptional regulator n=1 Tax=Thiomonas sp. FB-6 TaxID=1158291 RepID=UPI00035E1679|nr:BlaI/MecI/CopY family transcriptional regulator [Thiomonas sp. FB-6]
MPNFRLPADSLEYAVLRTLWELRRASVRELHERAGEPEGLVYTTTAKVVDRLRDKGLVERNREGGGFVYTPLIERNVVERARARQLMSRFLGPGPRPAVAALVDAIDEIDPALLDALESAIQARKERDHGA